LKHENKKTGSELMAEMEEWARKRKATLEGGEGDNVPKRLRMNASGKKILSDDIIDKSTKKSKNEPVVIMEPDHDNDNEKRSSKS